jgi:hypothetical protein
VKQDCDCDTPGDKNHQHNRKLYGAADRDMCIFLQERCSKWTGCDAREHRKPAIRDRQRTLMNEKHQASNTCDNRPYPGHDPNDDQANSPCIANHSLRLTIVVDVKRNADSDYATTCKDGNVFVTSRDEWWFRRYKSTHRRRHG